MEGSIQRLERPEHDRLLGAKESTQPPVELRKQLTVFNAVTNIVGNIVGSGIFITPTTVLMYTGSFGMSLVFWVIGGIIAICGGLVYVELGSMIKDSGGGYAYLREGFVFGRGKWSKVVGNAVSFLYIWCFTLLTMPLSVAILGQTAGVYLCQAMTGGKTPHSLPVQLIASSLIILTCLINMLSVPLTAKIINVLSVAKVLAMGFIMGLGVWQLALGKHLDNFKNAFDGTTTCTGDIILALYFVIYSYDGWCTTGFLVEESQNAQRNLSRGLYIGVPMIIACYVFVNISYYAGLSKIQLLSSPATALVFGKTVLGRIGLVIFPLLVSVSTIGALLCNIFTGPRATFSAARDGNFPEVLALLQNTSNTPVPSIILLMVLSVGFVFSGNIEQLINGLSVAEWIFYGLIFLSCIIMRITRRNIQRPYKVWIIVPVFLVLISLFLVLVPIALVPDKRMISLMVIVVVLLGLPIHVVFGWERIRPKIISKFSGLITVIVGLVLDCSSTRIEHQLTKHNRH